MRGENRLMHIAALGLLASSTAVPGMGGPEHAPGRNPSRGTGPGRQRAVARLAARADLQMPLPDRPISRQRRRWIERHPRDSRA